MSLAASCGLVAPFAESPVTRARATIGSAIAARDFGSKFFADGGHPGRDPQGRSGRSPRSRPRAAKAAWVNAVSGNRDPAVLGVGWEYDPIMVDPNDSQFLDLMRFAIEEACRFWRSATIDGLRGHVGSERDLRQRHPG